MSTRNVVTVIAALIVGAIVVVALAAPALSPYDPERQNIPERLRPPAFIDADAEDNDHIFGTDHFGRDVFSRTLHGAAPSLLIGITAVLIGATLGVSLGLVAGYFPPADAVLSRLADVQQTLPFIVLVVAVAAVLPPSFLHVILILGIASWVNYYRIVRAETLVIREQTYIEAAVAVGNSEFGILRRHVLPNVLPSVIVLMTLYLPQIVLFEAALGFLGLGVPPETPTWGGMIAAGRAYVEIAWWMSIFPGAALMLTVLAINLAGEGLRRRFEPRRRGT